MTRSRQRKSILDPEFIDWLKDAYPGTIIGDLQENDGASAAKFYNRGVAGLTDSALFPGTDILVDGDMEAATTAAWTVALNATLTKETTNPHSGSRVLRVARNGTNNPVAYQPGTVVDGERYTLPGWARSDGNATPYVTKFTGPIVWTGTISTEWQEINVEVLAENTSFLYRALTATGTEYCEFDDISNRAANPINADISGATVAQPFGGNIPYSYLFDSANDNLAVDGASLAAGFSLAKCEIVTFGKIDSAQATVRNLFRVTAGTDLCEIRNSDSGELTWRFKVGAVDEEIVVGSLATDENFMASILCEDGDNGDFVTAKFNGVQVGTSTGAGFGTVAAITAYTIGSADASQYWDGLLAPNILKPGGQFSNTEELEIYRRSGI